MTKLTFRRLLVGGACASALLAGSALAQEVDPVAAYVAPEAAAAEPALQQLPPLPDVQIPYTRHVLANGLTLIVHEDRKAPIVAVNIWYHVGSKNEPQGRSGFAHLFEHLMFNGSENFNSDFFKATELLGATDQNGTTNRDRTNYFQNVPTSGLDAILWLESDRMGHLLGAIDQARLDEQRGVVQNEKRQGENQPYGRAFNAITAATYPDDHPYGHTVIGSMDDLNAADLPTVQQWFRDYYGAANAVIVLAGDISSEEALAKVQYYFGDIPPGPPVTQPARMIAPMVGEQREVMYDNVGQPRFYKVWNVPPTGEAETDYLNLLAQVLTSGRNSRLFKRLVFDDQTATGVGAFVNEGQIGSQFIITVTGKPGEDLAALEAVVDEEMTRLLRDGPTPQELERARTSTGAGLVRGLERIGGFGGKSDRLAQSEVYHNDPNHWRTTYERILTARPQDLQSAGRRWLSDGSYTLEVLPFPQYAAAPGGADRSTIPPAGEMPMATFPAFERFTLTNGLDVILASRDGVPTVSMNLIVDSGSAGETSDKAGLAVLTPSVMTSGTDDLDALEISDRLQLLGATLGGGSGVDSTTMSMTAIASRLEESLELYADVILNPAFRPDDFERARVQQVAGIQQSDRNPGAVANRVLASTLYGTDNPYGRPSSGTAATVGALTPADAEAYHAAWFRPDNATLIVVGDIDRAELAPLLEAQFSGWRAPATPLPARGATTPAPTPERPLIFLVDRPGPQSTITAGRLVPALDPDAEPAITAFNTALGGAFTSRVNMNLREDKGWSYGAGSGLRGARGERLFLVSTGVQSDKTVESVQEIARELTEVTGARPVTDAELAAHRSNLVLGMAGDWETNAAVVGDLAQLVIYGLPDDYFNRNAAGIAATNPQNVNAAGRTLIGDGPTVWVIVGDRATLEPRLRALNLGEVRVVDVYGNPVQ
jgi:zinc protease